MSFYNLSRRFVPMNAQNKQSMEELAKRYTELNEKRIRAQSDLKHAEDQMTKLKSHAMTMWGTDDINVLESKLKEMRESNERKRADYQKHLDEIEANLRTIEESQ